MNILVTGVSGQLGHDLVIELRKRGHSVTGVSSKEVDLNRNGKCRFATRYYSFKKLIRI